MLEFTPLGNFPVKKTVIDAFINEHAPPITTPFDNIAETDSTDTLELLAKKNYVDKTKFYSWIMSKSESIAIMRPRRFGKTLLLDTIEKIAAGEEFKSKFENTYIHTCYWVDDTGTYINNDGESIEGLNENNEELVNELPVVYPWKKYPVIRVDFRCSQFLSEYDFVKDLAVSLENTARKYGVHEEFVVRTNHLNYRRIRIYLKTLIHLLAELKDPYQKEVIVLLDDVDHPFFEYQYTDKKVPQFIIRVMVDIFDVLKTQRGELMFKIITGVSALPLVQYVSTANDWSDISTDETYSTMFGFTKEEVENYFDDSHFMKLCSSICKKTNQPIPTGNKEIKTLVIKELTDWYGGHRFSEKNTTVFNPFSILECFYTSEPKNHCTNITQYSAIWNELMKDSDEYQGMIDAENLIVNERIIKVNIIGYLNKPVKVYTIAYQEGLLTITDTMKEGYHVFYQLGFPNKEVKENFKDSVRDVVMEKLQLQVKLAVNEHNSKLMDYLDKEEWDKFFELLKRIPYSYTSNDYFVNATDIHFSILLMKALIPLWGITTKSTKIIENEDAIIERNGKIYMFSCKFHYTKDSNGFYHHTGYMETFQKYHNVIKENKKPAVSIWAKIILICRSLYFLF